MKKQVKSFFIFTGIIILCCLIMIGSSYLYLEISLNSADADESQSNIPYAEPLPDSTGLLFVMPDNRGYLMFLDFKEEAIRIIRLDEVIEEKEEYYGYPISFTFYIERRFFSNMIDRIGGIELYDNGETLRYTGIQILDKIQESEDNPELIKEVLRKYLYEISQIGFAKEDFIYIIDNCETDLTVPACYYWPPYIAQISQNVRFVN